MKIYTAMIGPYTGEDRLDITRKSGDIRFAPSWDLVIGYKTGKISKNEYIKAYVKSMRISYLQNQDAWIGLVNREEITLMCYCKPFDFCHRYILAAFLLTEYRNISYFGERGFETFDSIGWLIKEFDGFEKLFIK